MCHVTVLTFFKAKNNEKEKSTLAFRLSFSLFKNVWVKSLRTTHMSYNSVLMQIMLSPSFSVQDVTFVASISLDFPLCSQLCGSCFYYKINKRLLLVLSCFLHFFFNQFLICFKLKRIFFNEEYFISLTKASFQVL